MQTMLLPILLTAVVLLSTGGGRVESYPQGPPVSACGDMFPSGHDTDAKTIAPPFTLTASTTTIAAGENVTLQLNATGDPTYPYFEGVFVQARRADCSGDEPIGTFSIPADDTFLKLMTCNKQANSAVSQKDKSHQTNKTFTWTVPDTYQGRVYFRATVVKNEKNFWTNVYSDYLTYSNDSSAAPSDYCAVRSELSSTASVFTASLVLAVVVTSFSFFWNM